MTHARFDLVTIDTPQPALLAEFWCAALGLHVVEREDEGRWIVLASVDGVRRIGLQRGAHRAGGMHLDLTCGRAEFELFTASLTQLGARRLGPTRTEPYGLIANFADPDGNCFDLCAYAIA